MPLYNNTPIYYPYSKRSVKSFDMTYTDYKVQYREVPPEQPSVLGCLTQFFFILVALAFMFIVSWAILYFSANK